MNPRLFSLVLILMCSSYNLFSMLYPHVMLEILIFECYITNNSGNVSIGHNRTMENTIHIYLDIDAV